MGAKGGAHGYFRRLRARAPPSPADKVSCEGAREGAGRVSQGRRVPLLVDAGQTGSPNPPSLQRRSDLETEPGSPGLWKGDSGARNRDPERRR